MIHNPQGAAWLVWLESSAVAVAMRQWLWLYPAVEVLHIAGIAALVGGAVMFDLRLLGVSRGLPVAALAAHLLTWSRVGLGLMAVSGALMFTATGVTTLIVTGADVADTPSAVATARNW